MHFGKRDPDPSSRGPCIRKAATYPKWHRTSHSSNPLTVCSRAWGVEPLVDEYSAHTQWQGRAEESPQPSRRATRYHGSWEAALTAYLCLYGSTRVRYMSPRLRLPLAVGRNGPGPHRIRPSDFIRQSEPELHLPDDTWQRGSTKGSPTKEATVRTAVGQAIGESEPPISDPISRAKPIYTVQHFMSNMHAFSFLGGNGGVGRQGAGCCLLVRPAPPDRALRRQEDSSRSSQWSGTPLFSPASSSHFCFTDGPPSAM
ncbi:hypothetical protein L209DRAFT_801480 [Thermothelomyces heterothallicus CBS 203.75]